MRFTRSHVAEQRSINARVMHPDKGRMYTCDMGEFHFVVSMTGLEGTLWVASYKRTPFGHGAVFIGDRYGIEPIPKLPTFDTQTEAENACNRMLKTLRSPN